MKRNVLNSNGFSPLQTAASIWWQWRSYPQTAASEHDPKGTQPQFPIVKSGVYDSACFLPQPAVPGPEAVYSQSSAVPLSVPYEICNGYGEWSMDEKLLAATEDQ
ncbi:hypothetical protein ASPFODRAFT_212678 [Aspergillus luchuensis CBS 106.47]|uniref:Uncharacterized protein n=1 Tax=Aspergillus luchuensis (strain CBS 106.47) TaxID=1137211 RepID=A0A1M3T127_ASPLC|nr:hypothetical protein ASPFODRAFT_212678 [Aspergillus luchuensis CBS 106.47]